MKQYIFGARNGIYIVDLQKTVKMFRDAYDFITEVTASGKSVLFVGTKKQARETIAEESVRAGMYFVNNRWLGGMLTNYQTIKKSVERLNYLDTIHEDGTICFFLKRKDSSLVKSRARLPMFLAVFRPWAVFSWRDIHNRSKK